MKSAPISPATVTEESEHESGIPRNEYFNKGKKISVLEYSEGESDSEFFIRIKNLKKEA